MKIERTKEWWMKRAELEGDSVVSAGLPFSSEDEVTVLFVSSLWLSLLGDKLGAAATMDAALHVHSMNTKFRSGFRP